MSHNRALPSAAAMRSADRIREAWNMDEAQTKYMARVIDEEIRPLLEALEALVTYNENIAAGRIRHNPEDHIFVAERAIDRAKGDA